MSERDLNPFCANEHCLLHHHVADPEAVEIDITFPNGSVATVERVGLKFPNGGYDTLCSACFRSFEVLQLNKGLKIQSLTYVSDNFCSNEKCWLYTVECNHENNELEIYDDESKAMYKTSRDWFKLDSGHRKQFCFSCKGAFDMTNNPSRWPEVQSDLILKDNRIVLPASKMLN